MARSYTLFAYLLISLICGAVGIASVAAQQVGPVVPGQRPTTDAQLPQLPNQQYPIIRNITVVGNERVEAATVISYLAVRVGDPADPILIDQSLKNLYRTELFDDIDFSEAGGVVVIRVVENPIINRVVFEGNKRLDNEDLLEEVRLRPRQVFTRSKVRADVQRMLVSYQRSGRFAAIIEPKVVQLEQNRVDLLFEIQEGPKSRVSRVNFMGNKKYSDGELRDVLATKEARWWKIFTSNDTFDPDRLGYDQEVLRQFYLNEGYADFRTISAVAELTADREDFFITFTIEEGEQYNFGEITVKSEIRDLKEVVFRGFLQTRSGSTYNAEQIEKTIEALTDAAGLFGYATVDIVPEVKRDREKRIIDIEFVINDAPRVYVERVNIRGNVRTLDRVIRREFRIREGDAFSSTAVRQSEVNLQRLQFFREVEITQDPGSLPDRIVLTANVEEQATGQLNVAAGFSSLENFIFDFSIQQDNFAGTGRTVRLGTRLSSIQQTIDLGLSDPYFLGRRVGAGVNFFVRRTRPTGLGFGLSPIVDSFGASFRLGAALNDLWFVSTRYSIRDENTRFEDSAIDALFDGFLTNITPGPTTPFEEAQELIAQFDNNGNGEIDGLDFDTNGDGSLDQTEQLLAVGGFNTVLLESFGQRITSTLGYTIGSDTRNSFIRPTRGRNISFSQDFAGVGGNVRFLRTTISYDNYWTPISGWTFRHSLDAGIIDGLGSNLRTVDRFFIGGPRIRGFNNAGIGPRVFRSTQGGLGQILGGTAFYIGRAELFLPLGEAALESGINASIFMDAGSSFRSQVAGERCQFSRSEFLEFETALVEANANGDQLPTFGFNTNCIAGDSVEPRVTVGIGVSWQSPFGPFRVDLSTPLRQQLGDDTQTLQFNVGTTF